LHLSLAIDHAGLRVISGWVFRGNDLFHCGQIMGSVVLQPPKTNGFEIQTFTTAYEFDPILLFQFPQIRWANASTL